MSRPSPLPAPVTATVRWFALATTTSFTTVPLSKDQPAFEAASCTKALSSVRTDRLGGARIKKSRLIGCNACLIGTAVLGLRVERYHFNLDAISQSSDLVHIGRSSDKSTIEHINATKCVLRVFDSKGNIVVVGNVHFDSLGA